MFNNCSKDKIIARRSEFDLKIIDRYTAGISLLGNEIKSIRGKFVSINSSFIICRNSEMYIHDMFIKKYKNANYSFSSIDERRIRKLLLKKNEIKKISRISKEKGFAVFPLRLFIKSNRFAKIEIVVAQKKKKYQIKIEKKDKEIKRRIRKREYE